MTGEGPIWVAFKSVTTHDKGSPGVRQVADGTPVCAESQDLILWAYHLIQKAGRKTTFLDRPYRKRSDNRQVGKTFLKFIYFFT